MKSIPQSFIGGQFAALVGKIILLLLITTFVAPLANAQDQNTATGTDALANNTEGDYNTADGYVALFSNTIGSSNTAVGAAALVNNIEGNSNTAVGNSALLYNTSSYNTATGQAALVANSTGTQNTATGASALYFNNGSYNTATGFQALTRNTTGTYNTATGYLALNFNQTGVQNTASGVNALRDNTGSFNAAHGVNALQNNTSGAYNTASGYLALANNRTGTQNTATGVNALLSNSGSFNTADGVNALYRNTTGSNNIALGRGAGFNLTTGSNNIVIGHPGGAGLSNTTAIGTNGVQTATYIAGIRGATVPGGIAVFVAANGRLGTATSSKRFKQEIKPMEKESESVFELKPVTFRYNEELDPDGIAQFGLVAEEVEKVNPDLVAYDEKGKAYTVRYEAVNAMLLNEFLKEHGTVQELKTAMAKQNSIIAQQQKEIQLLAESLKEQALQIQKVSAQIAARDSGSQLVVNTR